MISQLIQGCMTYPSRSTWVHSPWELMAGTCKSPKMKRKMIFQTSMTWGSMLLFQACTQKKNVLLPLGVWSAFYHFMDKPKKCPRCPSTKPQQNKYRLIQNYSFGMFRFFYSVSKPKAKQNLPPYHGPTFLTSASSSLARKRSEPRSNVEKTFTEPTCW